MGKKKKDKKLKPRDPYALDAMMGTGAGPHLDKSREDKYGIYWDEDEEDDSPLIDTSCPLCGQPPKESMVEEEFDYGVPTEATLTATVVQLDCEECEFTWTDERADLAREAAVDIYLEKKDG